MECAQEEKRVRYNITINMLLVNFENFLKNERKYSLHTVRAYIDDLKQFFTFINLGQGDVSLITANDIRCWVVELKNNQMSQKSINRKISSLKPFKTHMTELPSKNEKIY